MTWRWLTRWLSPTAEPTHDAVPYLLPAPEELEREEQQKRLLREQLDRASETLRHLETQWHLRRQGTHRDTR